MCANFGFGALAGPLPAGHLLAELDPLARRNAEEIRGPPDQVALELAHVTVGIDHFPHHFDHAAATVLFERAIDQLREMIEIDRLVLGRGRFRGQFARHLLVEAESPLDERVQLGALHVGNRAVDGGSVDEQRRCRKAIIVVLEMGRTLLALRDVGLESAKAFEHDMRAVSR